jgi:hypothetical protein
LLQVFHGPSSPKPLIFLVANGRGTYNRQEAYILVSIKNRANLANFSTDAIDAEKKKKF